MKLKAAVVAVVALVGCGGGTEGATNTTGGGLGGVGGCVQRSGTYRINMTARSGNCGTSAEYVESLSSQPTDVAAPCSGTIQYSNDNCAVTTDVTCPAENDTILRTTGKVTWSQNAGQGSGIVSLLLKNSSGTTVCQGTYDAVYTRL